jgi:hypothetical protein
MFSKYLALSILICLTVVSGIIQGQASFRWGIPDQLLRVAAELQQCDLSSEDWRLQKRVAFDGDVLRVLKCNGFINHVYENQETGEVVAIAVMVGPTGPMVAHTPEICYPSGDYVMCEPKSMLNIAGRDDAAHHQLHATMFRCDNVHQNRLRVYYGWSIYAPDKNGAWSTQWKSPQRPRLAYANEPFLFRVQVATVLNPVDADVDEDAAVRFMTQSLDKIEFEKLVPVDPR